MRSLTKKIAGTAFYGVMFAGGLMGYIHLDREIENLKNSQYTKQILEINLQMDAIENVNFRKTLTDSRLYALVQEKYNRLKDEKEKIRKESSYSVDKDLSSIGGKEFLRDVMSLPISVGGILGLSSLIALAWQARLSYEGTNKKR
jgi:hypothetical protein